MKTDSTEDEQKPRGFDAAVKRREDDYLNRWPLAREVYGIAVTGPKQWSVRIGIYGEWGTGKTSVLEFIASMAKKDEQIVIRFNPWQHSTKDSLWRAFVLAVFSELEATFGKLPEADAARTKDWVGKAKNVITSVAAVANERVGKAVQASLDLVKQHFAFSQEDLNSLREIVGDKRIIILIDDLDRTAPELVPEILFALKELMDIPGFVFVCAFDPVVVGKVLRRYNPAFGQGLGFLEKIIDYPRWLPPPAPDALISLAIAEAKQFCDYVPQQALRDAVPLLPANPRAVRQFIRLLALLRPQIRRYYDHELYWPVILAANVLKIRHPRLAHGLLRDENFWERIDQTSFLNRDAEERTQINNEIDRHIEKVASDLGIVLAPPQRTEIKTALSQICSQLNRWALRTTSFLAEQMEIAEAPHAVTWKEYDQFLDLWLAKQGKKTVEGWITKHAEEVERSIKRVYSELFEATLGAYSKALREADGAFAEADRAPHEKKAEALIGLIECLIFDLARLDAEEKQLDAKQLERLLETFASFVGSTSPVQSRLSARNEQVLVQLIENWSGDVAPLMAAIHPYDAYRFTHFEGASVRALHQKLCREVLPKFARQIVRGFREAGFADHLISGSETYNARCMLLNPTGVLWKDLRPEAFKILNEAKINRLIQENSYQFLHWFDYQLREQKQAMDTDALRKFLSDGEISKALWSAATATPLSLASVARIHRFPDELNALGVTVECPNWWTEAVRTLTQSIKKPPIVNEQPQPEENK